MTCRSRIRFAVLAGALVAPAWLSAQGTDTLRTHVVQRGETLWRIATEHLGDGHRWREILQLNQEIVRSEQDLPVGATIRLPAARRARPMAPSEGATARTAAAPAPAAAPVQTIRPPAPPPQAPARSTTPPPARSDTGARGRADSAAPPTARAPSRTIFFGASPGGAAAPVRTSADSPGAGAAPRAVAPPGTFEALSVPYVIEPALLERSGTCVDVGAGAGEREVPGGVMLHGTVIVTPPRGDPAADGARLVMARLGPMLPGLGRVVLPTAVVRLSGTGSQRRAEVVAQFGVVACDDIVVAPADVSIPHGVPAPVAAGPEGRVAWVSGDALLPTLQHTLIVEVGAGSGVRPGDRLTVFSEGGGGAVAVAMVVRVDGRAASALVISQSRPAIAAGLPVRVTEKLP